MQKLKHLFFIAVLWLVLSPAISTAATDVYQTVTSTPTLAVVTMTSYTVTEVRASTDIACAMLAFNNDATNEMYMNTLTSTTSFVSTGIPLRPRCSFFDDMHYGAWYGMCGAGVSSVEVRVIKWYNRRTR